jgi:hypothetical protein
MCDIYTISSILLVTAITFINITIFTNPIIQNFINALIPILALVLTRVYYKPDIFIKIAKWKAKNVKTRLKIIVNSEIDEKYFKKIMSIFTEDCRIIRENFGEYIYQYEFLHDKTSYFVAKYDVENQNIYIEMSSKMSMKQFYNFASDIIQRYTKTFTNCDAKIIDEKIEIDIEYKDDLGDNISNPFVYIMFKPFHKKNLKLSFFGSNDTLIKIMNNNISFSNNNIISIKKDIEKTLYFFKRLS